MNTQYVDANPSLSGVNDGFNLKDFLRLALDHAGTILGIAALFVLLAVAYVSLATPLYSADVLVRIDSPEPNALGIAPQGQGVAPQPLPVTDAEVAMMQSRAVVWPVIEKYGLEVTATPRTVPLLGSLAKKWTRTGRPSDAWFGLESYAWGGESLEVGSLIVPSGLENRPLVLRVLDNNRYELRDTQGNFLLEGMAGRPVVYDGISILISRMLARPRTEFIVTRWNAVSALKRFSTDLKVAEMGKETGLIRATFDSSDPVLAAGVVNSLADRYIEATVESHRLNDSKTLDFIKAELPRLREDLREAEAQLATYQISASSLQPTAEALSYLQGGIEFQRQIAALQLQRTQLRQSFTEGSPPVMTVNQQLAQLTTAKVGFDSRFNSMPASERRSVDLTRNAKVAEAIYVAMVNKAEELTVRRAGTTGDVHIVDSALRPFDPVKPNRMLIVAASVQLGLMMGLLFVFVRSRVFTGVTDPMFVEYRLSVPVFGAVLYSTAQRRLDRDVTQLLPLVVSSKPETDTHMRAAIPDLPVSNGKRRLTDARAAGDRPAGGLQRLLTHSAPHDLSIEALRSVRTAMQFNVAAARNNIVAVVGPTPSTGKSFVSANLAALEAETGKRVLLVDADMRCGRLASRFNQSNAGGLSELLTGGMELHDTIRAVGVPGLSFLSCGTYPLNPSALLMMPHFAHLLNELARRFDMVIIDTPPLLAVSDAAVIANPAGSTLLVLRSGMQTEDEIELTVTKLRRAGAHVVGAIFNAMPARRSDRRSYGYTAAYTNHDVV